MTIGEDDLYKSPNDGQREAVAPKVLADAPWLDEVPEEEGAFFQGNSRNIAVAFGGILALAVFVSLVWYLYGRANDINVALNVPTIRASKDPIKVEPEDRGGMQVPDQDKLVFDRVNGKARGAAEKVQPKAEEPKAAPTETARKPKDDPKAYVKTASAKPAAKKPTSTQPKAKETKPAGLSASDIPANSFMVQMGAFGSVLRATTAWDRFLIMHPRPLATLSYHIQPVTLVGGSKLYRLRAGPFVTKAPADETCRVLKVRGQACIVVPGK